MGKEKDKIISLTQAQDKGIALSPQLDSNLLTPKHWTGTLYPLRYRQTHGQ